MDASEVVTKVSAYVSGKEGSGRSKSASSWRSLYRDLRATPVLKRLHAVAERPQSIEEDVHLFSDLMQFGEIGELFPSRDRELLPFRQAAITALTCSTDEHILAAATSEVQKIIERGSDHRQAEWFSRSTSALADAIRRPALPDRCLQVLIVGLLGIVHSLDGPSAHSVAESMAGLVATRPDLAGQSVCSAILRELGLRAMLKGGLETLADPPLLGDGESEQLVCIASVKGGVGKTSLALFISAALAEHGKVALVEADSEGPSLLWKLEWQQHHFQKAVGEGDCPFFHDAFHADDFEQTPMQYLHEACLRLGDGTTSRPFWVMPASGDPATVESMSAFGNRPGEGATASRSLPYAQRLKEMVEALLVNGGFNHVVVDTSPGLAGNSFAAVAATVLNKGTVLFATRNLPEEIVALVLETNGLLRFTTKWQNCMVVKNMVAPMLVGRARDSDWFTGEIAASDSSFAYFRGKSSDEVRAILKGAIERIGLCRALEVPEIPALRFASQIGMRSEAQPEIAAGIAELRKACERIAAQIRANSVAAASAAGQK